MRELPSDDALRRLLPQYKGDQLEAIECYLLLLRSVNDMLQPVEALLARRKLSRGRLSVLLRLLREHPRHVAVSTLAHDCGVRQATMTGLLEGLVQTKLVRRKICRKDKRVSHVNITPKGMRLMEALLPAYFAQVENLSQLLGQRDRNALIKLLRQFIDSVAEASREPSHGGRSTAGKRNPSASHGQVGKRSKK